MRKKFSNFQGNFVYRLQKGCLDFELIYLHVDNVALRVSLNLTMIELFLMDYCQDISEFVICNDEPEHRKKSNHLKCRSQKSSPRKLNDCQTTKIFYSIDARDCGDLVCFLSGFH